jgi:tRNA-specific 2-thiouridylase
VDSSVAAALLQDQGYEVIGVMLRLWSDDDVENRCCPPDAQLEARQVAAQLDIPFYVMDAQAPFYQHVVEPFVDAYAQGFTPNPCLNCNQFIRWGFLQDRAQSLDAAFIATGHYAKIRKDPRGKFQLLKNHDPDKDQSYFLHVLTQQNLRHTLFPLAEISKPEVRRLAQQFNLSAASRPDSQDLCFVGQGNYRDFLRKFNSSLIKSGPIINTAGEQLGTHTGLADYTIGQRKGLGIPGPEPYYVFQKDTQENTLIIGPKSVLGRDRFLVHNPNWISGEELTRPIRVQTKIRYKSQEVPGTIKPYHDHRLEVTLDTPLSDITPGQAAVFYQGDICLGGGIIHLEEL